MQRAVRGSGAEFQKEGGAPDNLWPVFDVESSFVVRRGESGCVMVAETGGHQRVPVKQCGPPRSSHPRPFLTALCLEGHRGLLLGIIFRAWARSEGTTSALYPRDCL